MEKGTPYTLENWDASVPFNNVFTFRYTLSWFFFKYEGEKQKSDSVCVSQLTLKYAVTNGPRVSAAFSSQSTCPP